MAETKVFYICDRRACEKCNPRCNHTGDIRHAKNFEAIPDGSMWEQENKGERDRHGYWIDRDHGFQMCSACGEECVEDRDDLPFKAFGFCPYCGAKMDEPAEVEHGKAD